MPSNAKWLTVDEALERLEQAVPDTRPATETLETATALGRVVAATPLALINVPPADNSAMDGFAVNTNDLPAVNTHLAISQRIPAGTAPQPLLSGTAARIFTGSEVPEGANAVVMQENCDYNETQVTIKQLPPEGNNIRSKGDDICLDQPLLTAGHKLRPQDIGLLIAAGVAEVSTYKKLQVSIIATGDELIPVGQPLQAGQIYESNSPMLAALLTANGYQVTTYRAPDDLETTVELLTEAAKADAVITIGGVSVGEEDHVKAALNQLGDTDFWKIGLKPGKPFLLGSIAGKPLMGLPGNPVSAFVTYALFCKPFLNKLQGGSFNHPRHWLLEAGFSINKPSPRQQYLRATLATDPQGKTTVKLLKNQSSAVQTSLCNADVLAVIPPEATITEGQVIQVISMAELTAG